MKHSKIVRIFEHLYQQLVLDEDYNQISQKQRRLHAVAFIYCIFMIWIMILFALLLFPNSSPVLRDILIYVALGGTLFFICMWAYSEVETIKLLKYLLRRQHAFFEHLEDLGITFVILGKPTHPAFQVTTPGVVLNSGALDKYLQYPGEFCYDSLPRKARVEPPPPATVDTYFAFITLAMRLARLAWNLCRIYFCGIIFGICVFLYVFPPWGGGSAPVVWFPLDFVLTVLGIISVSVFAILYTYEAHWLIYVQIPLGYDIQAKIWKYYRSG